MLNYTITFLATFTRTKLFSGKIFYSNPVTSALCTLCKARPASTRKLLKNALNFPAVFFISRSFFFLSLQIFHWPDLNFGNQPLKFRFSFNSSLHTLFTQYKFRYYTILCLHSATRRVFIFRRFYSFFGCIKIYCKHLKMPYFRFF